MARLPGAPGGAGPRVAAPASRRRRPASGLRPPGELRRQREETPGDTPGAYERAPAVASGSASQSAGNARPGTPRTRRRRRRRRSRRRRSPDRAGEARGDPPRQSKQGLDSRRALTGSRGRRAAEPRPAGPGQAGPKESDWGVAAAEAAGGHGRARAASSGGAVPAAPEVFCAGASLPVGVGPRSSERLTAGF